MIGVSEQMSSSGVVEQTAYAQTNRQKERFAQRGETCATGRLNISTMFGYELNERKIALGPVWMSKKPWFLAGEPRVLVQPGVCGEGGVLAVEY